MRNLFQAKAAKIAAVGVAVFLLAGLIYWVRSSIAPGTGSADEGEFLLVEAGERELDGAPALSLTLIRPATSAAAHERTMAGCGHQRCADGTCLRPNCARSNAGAFACRAPEAERGRPHASAHQNRRGGTVHCRSTAFGSRSRPGPASFDRCDGDGSRNPRRPRLCRL